MSGTQEAPKTPEEASYVVKSTIREYFKKANKRVDSDLFSALNKHVEWTLKKATERAEKNKRATVRPEDI